MTGLCLPWQEAHRDFRTQFATTWGYQLADLETLHAKLANVIRHAGALATFAHHHEIAEKHSCPRTRAEMEAREFTSETPLRVLEDIAQPADVYHPHHGECSICTLPLALAGAEIGLGCPRNMEDPQCIGGGIAISNHRLDEDIPVSPAPGTTLIPPVVRDGLQKEAAYCSDGCHAGGLQGSAGTWGG
eukprot:5146971-Pyramimonas_sp.AAC.1